MARLARYHDDLAAVMTFMRDEIGEHVADVEREVAPHVPFRRRDLPPRGNAQLEQRFDPVAAAFQRSYELLTFDTTVIDESGRRNAMFPPQRLDPPAPPVVNVGRDRSDRAPRLSRDGDVPEGGRQALDELDRDPEEPRRTIRSIAAHI